MPLDITCPSCGITGTVPDKLRGQTVKCPRCEGPIKVTGPSMVVPVDAALLQEAQTQLRPKLRPTAPRIDPLAQPRVPDFSFKYWFLSMLLAGGSTVVFLIIYVVVALFMK